MALNKEMDDLKQLVLKMSDTVVLNITDAINYYLGKKECHEINDDLIDQYERMLEAMCINILLRERPFAKDLKEVTGVLKLVSDIERIGDHAEDILEFAKKIEHCEKDELLGIKELATYVLNMLKDAIKAYVDKDFELSKKVIDADDYVDKRYIEIIEKLTLEKNINNEYIPFAIYTTLVVKYLERIADHCVNIAEWVVYISSGYHKDKMIF